MIKNEMVERRRYVRFKADGGAVAVLRRPWPYSSTLGQIVDVSLGGLAFDHVNGHEKSNGSFGLELLRDDCGFHSNKIPFETVSEDEIDNETSGGLSARRRRIRFECLTDHQKSDLSYFIQHYTSADPEA